MKRSIMKGTVTASLCLLLMVAPAHALWEGSKSGLEQATVEVAFSPQHGATDLVIKAIGEARKTIRVAAYSFTSRPIEEALKVAHGRGVDVRMVVDKSNEDGRRNSVWHLAQAGIPVHVDFRYSIMHDKFVVIDDATVETGSFNFTAAAERRNAENVMVLRNAPAIARKYGAEWKRLWNESEEFR